MDSSGSKSVFAGSKLLVTGGTGTFGHAVVRRMLKAGLAEIRIFSRDEKKRDDMRREFSDPTLRFYLGDVREASSLATAMGRRRFRLPRSCAEAGSELRVLSPRSDSHERDRNRKRAHVRTARPSL